MIHKKKKNTVKKAIVDLNKRAKELHPFSTIFYKSADLSQQLIHDYNQHHIRFKCRQQCAPPSFLRTAGGRVSTKQHCGMFRRKGPTALWHPCDANEYKSTDLRDYR